jgi:hypothetical protein
VLSKYTFGQSEFVKFKIQQTLNEGKSAAKFCPRWQQGSQICSAALKSHKIANNSATTEARIKIRTDLEPVEF